MSKQPPDVLLLMVMSLVCRRSDSGDPDAIHAE